MVVGLGESVADPMAAMVTATERVTSGPIVYVVVRFEDAPIGHDSAATLVATVRIALVILRVASFSRVVAVSLVAGKRLEVSRWVWIRFGLRWPPNGQPGAQLTILNH